MPADRTAEFSLFDEDIDVGDSAPENADQDDDEVQAIEHSRDGADPFDIDGEAS
jgi:hypothetical protein